MLIVIDVDSPSFTDVSLTTGTESIVGKSSLIRLRVIVGVSLVTTASATTISPKTKIIDSMVSTKSSSFRYVDISMLPVVEFGGITMD